MPNGEVLEPLESLDDWYAHHETVLTDVDAIAICLVNDYSDGLMRAASGLS